MKREDQKANSRTEILQAAMHEFSVKSFDGASITAICTDNNLSKGRVYHYFTGKDDMYLACVAKCFEKFGEYMSEHIVIDKKNVAKTVETYFSARYRFFSKFPDMKNVFVSAKLHPPEHLLERIGELSRGLENINNGFIAAVIQMLPLRDVVSRDDLNGYLSAFETFFFTYFNHNQLAKSEKHHVINQSYGGNAANLLLYGIARREPLS